MRSFEPLFFLLLCDWQAMLKGLHKLMEAKLSVCKQGNVGGMKEHKVGASDVLSF